MKIAYFSPFPPKRSGISTYSEELVRALRQLMEVHCFDFDNDEAGNPAATFGDFDRKGRISDLAEFEAVIYHLGNNPHFHLSIFKTMRHWPGIVVLHDTVLYFLIAGLGYGGLLKYLSLVEDRNAPESLREIIQSSVEHDILRYPRPEKHPLLAAIFPYATRIIVHNESARQQLVKAGYREAIHVVPHLAFRSAKTQLGDQEIQTLRRHHGIEAQELVIGCFGGIGRTKRIPQICAALGRLNGRIKFRFLLVGEGDDVSDSIRSAGLEERTIRTGFVEPAQFSEYLAASDILVNLRYPSMGEASGTLVRGLESGKPTIVTRHAGFTELPDEAVCKIDLGPDEERDLAATIENLAQDPVLRARIGQAAQHYVATTLEPSHIARQFQRIIKREIQDRESETVTALEVDDSARIALEPMSRAARS